MGGLAPLGYDARDRHLLVDPDEAQKVNYIFDRYLELGTVRELKKDLATQGFVSARRVSNQGTSVAAPHFHAVRSIICSPTQSTWEKFGTRKSATRDSTKI